MKKSLVFILSSIAQLTAVFIMLGVLFNKDENQKQEGMTDIFAISTKNEIAYVSYHKGQATINLDSQQNLVQLSVEKEIADITFSEDGTHLAYIVRNKDLENHIGSDIHVIDLGSLIDQVVHTSDSLITEMAFDPKYPEKLFYIEASTYTNYSPIASKHPHDFDVYSFDLMKGIHTKHTDMKKYSMGSLQVSAEKNSVYVQTNDDTYNETAEEVFASKERIFEIPLDTPDKKSVISNPVQAEDVYDFILLPEQQSIIYQAVAGTGTNGIYEYELFTFNWKTHQTEQLTTLKESTSKPAVGPDDKIYFMVDREFGSRKPDYHLYRMNQDGSGIEELELNG
ncbi:hypothetical protein CSV61_12830 [Sporosarcina sp. P3]|uniref:hypothetical protein n=1 Tax=Sporosarcina sp. P3 TaxID=2048245 RepID=UPI000C16895B|nr:hypothetical protein [Sporosarcina sp. P3]PID20864.1 hypothetical protein CSV61_12830 [Sporosarcina sp. P3]